MICKLAGEDSSPWIDLSFLTLLYASVFCETNPSLNNPTPSPQKGWRLKKQKRQQCWYILLYKCKTPYIKWCCYFSSCIYQKELINWLLLQVPWMKSKNHKSDVGLIKRTNTKSYIFFWWLHSVILDNANPQPPSY